MRKFITLCMIALLALGCKVKIEGPYNETVHLNLPQNHTAKIHFSHKNGKINANVFLNKKDVDTYRAHYTGVVKYVGEKQTYVFPMEQVTYYMDKLPKKERAYYTDPHPTMTVQYSPKTHAYSFQFSGSKCPILQTSNTYSTGNEKWEEMEQEVKNGSFWTKVKYGIAKAVVFVHSKIQNGFDRTFGKLDFSSRWWFAFYLGGLLIMAIGLKLFTPLCWIGVIMQYAYLQYMSPPFFMLWPSIVGWGWMILCVIPVVIVICMDAVLCVSVIISTFINGFVNFLIMFIPMVICIMSLYSLFHIAITDHIELIVFFIIGALGGGKQYIGTFIDANGNVWRLYK